MGLLDIVVVRVQSRRLLPTVNYISLLKSGYLKAVLLNGDVLPASKRLDMDLGRERESGSVRLHGKRKRDRWNEWS